METAFSDRFPLRLAAIKTSKAVDRPMIELAYLFLKDPAIPADTGSDIYVTRNHSRLIAKPETFTNYNKKKINTRLQNYETLIQLFPEQNFYILYLESLADSKSNPLNSYFLNADNGRSIQYFSKRLPKGLVLVKMLLKSFEEYENYYYKTDHHWNIRGVCRGYDLIYPILARNYPKIPPKRNCSEFIALPGIKFLGSYARKTLYSIEPEVLEVSATKLPSYEILLDGKVINHTKLDQYLVGDFNQYPYADHLENIFGSIEQSIEYYFKDNPPRNLLLIGSSSRKPIEPFIASHYRHTYIIDLRYVEAFSLGKFMTENQVDDILVIGERDVAYGSLIWQINP
jgi:hypothetical protein